MKIGTGLDTGGTIDDIVGRARRLAASGVASLWASQIFGWDTLTALAIVGREVEGVTLGTAVVPAQPRHPVMLAAQALTVQAASGGRLDLGIGLSHQVVIENVFGLAWERPARYMREYLSVLVPLLRGEQVSFQGEMVRANTFGPLEIPAVEPPPVLVAALGPQMLRVTAELAAGTVTWMTGPVTLAEHIVPVITREAERAGTPPPRIVVHLPVCITTDPDGARARAAKTFAIYGQLPSYRAMLDREGAAGPPDLAIVGDDETVAGEIRRVAEAGATEFGAIVFGDAGEQARTHEFVSTLARTSP
jgi:F420-dependent oxidoreductase-like protein